MTHALLTDTLYLNAPSHVLELFSDNTELARVRVLSPPSTGADVISHNTDAVDIHGSPFYVHDVNFTTGDDNIAAHANDTLVEDSYFGTGHGASIGSLCNSWLRNITFRNISFRGTTAGCRIKSHPGCAGHVWDVTYEGLTMEDVTDPITVTQYYDGPGASTYLFSDIAFRDIKVTKTSKEEATAAAAEAAAAEKGAAASSSKSSLHGIDIRCDNHYDGKANCQRFTLEDITFGHGVSGDEMYCQGVLGEAKHVQGIDTSCLKKDDDH